MRPKKVRKKKLRLAWQSQTALGPIRRLDFETILVDFQRPNL